ncbi:MAG: hypothetical protein JW984_01310 [Deltaproteobacteria bacterium]|uniref:Uncharacterized protein n=1 Tax=Candidatus Zymogenus saltonus TaxID=2844893 RepID=A0A9D8KCX0_9DELT|nr:hypothetical protein [Candidatus Zymogenus saltonus]
MKFAKGSLYIIIAFLILLNTTAAYSITIEEFIKKHPDAEVSMGAAYYPNNSKFATGSSGLVDDDMYALEMKNIIPFRTLYESGIV